HSHRHGVHRMEKWKTKKRFPTFPCDARDDNHGFSLSNPTPKKGSRSLRGLLTLPTFRIILYWNQTRFQDHSWIGKCLGVAVLESADRYCPSSAWIAAAMLCAKCSTRSSWGPSTITRASGSVPENRTRTRP